jgi:3-hydroxybutyryl-CoA dehydratase
MSSYFFEDLEVGMQASHEKTVSESDITNFADISGDFNPVHMYEDYAVGTFFKSRIAHGMLIASFISTVLGTQLPGHLSVANPALSGTRSHWRYGESPGPCGKS